MIAPQQFLIQNQDPWYSLSFLCVWNDLTVTILAEKLEAQKEDAFVETDYSAEFEYATTKQLLDDGFIKLTKEKKVDLNF